MTRNLLEEARAHWPAALGLARSLLRDHALAEDLCQEAFLRLARKRNQIDLDRPLKPLILTMVRNLAITELRRHHLGSLDEALDAGAHPPLSVQPSPVEAAGNAEAIVRMKLALDRLPPTWRALLYLREGLGFSPAQIGEVMETSSGVVRTTLHRARLRVRELMGADAVEESFE